MAEVTRRLDEEAHAALSRAGVEGEGGECAALEQLQPAEVDEDVREQLEDVVLGAGVTQLGAAFLDKVGPGMLSLNLTWQQCVNPCFEVTPEPIELSGFLPLSLSLSSASLTKNVRARVDYCLRVCEPPLSTPRTTTPRGTTRRLR